MAEIADWSPVDESNNTAPPAGAPEMMAPSAVNNTMRAMMGSIRRWYDTITTQLATYLPLTGGVVTGDTVFNGPSGISINGIGLSNVLGALYVHNHAGGGGGISIDGPSNGYVFADRDGVSAPWVWYANAGAAHFLRLDGSDIITVSWAGQVGVAGNLAVSGNQTIGGSLGVSGNITAAGSVNVAYVNSSGGMAASGAISCGGLSSSGNIGAAGSVNGAFLDSSGGIDADGNINAGGNITAAGTVTGNAVTANSVNATTIFAGSGGLHSTNGVSTADVLGGQTYALYTSGSTSYLQFLDQASNANRWEWDGASGDLQYRSLNVVQWVMRRSLDSMCFNAIGPVGGNGAYVNTSDRRGKEDIANDTCGLAAVLQLNPVSFRRIGQDDREVGFIAQELREVLPQAVRVVAIPLPDGTGGPDDGEPTLGMTETPIVAALVNAVKELSDRMQTLEGVKQ